MESTSGRFFSAHVAYYYIPTSFYHFQSADSLAVVPNGDAGDAGVLLASLGRRWDGISLWRALPPGETQEAPPRVVYLGGMEPVADAFSMAPTPCGRFLLTGMLGGRRQLRLRLLERLPERLQASPRRESAGARGRPERGRHP